RQRRYVDTAGAPLAAEFVQQSITEALHDPEGARLADGSVDVVHSAGVIGHHLDEAAVGALAREVARVLRPDGIAILDAGPRIPPRKLRRIVLEHGFEEVARHRVTPLGSRATLAFRRR